MIRVPFIDYALTDHGLEVKIFGRTMRRIAYSDMESVRKGWTLWNEHWDRRFDVRRSAVTIRRKSGLIRNFQVTPEDPDRFIRDLQASIARKPLS